MPVTMAGFFPPISIISGRGTARAALSRISFSPTSFDPVKTMPSMPSLSMSSWPDGRSRPGDEVEHARRQAGFDDHLGEHRAHQRRIARRLEHDRISRGKRAARRSRRERERKIERRDDGPHAVRPQHADVVFAGPERPHLFDESVVLLDLIAVVGHEIGAFFDIAHAFEPVLADLVTHQRREVVPVGANRIGNPPHVRRAAPATSSAAHAGYAARAAATADFTCSRVPFWKRAEGDARCQSGCDRRTARQP